MSAAHKPDVRFDAATSLGWITGPLDGLSCYLRCVEAVLRHRGLTLAAVRAALAQPLDLLRRESTSSEFRYCRVKWTIGDPEDNWIAIRRKVEAGEPVILSPDRFYWRGDEFEGQAHFQDHMVLVTRVSNETVTILDTDARAKDAYQRTLVVNDRLVRACTRFGVVELDADIGSGDVGGAAARELLDRSRLNLKRDVAAARWFLDRWNRSPISDPVARGLHVMILGDFQPQLFLLGGVLSDCVDPAATAVRRLADSSARRSMQLGMVLVGEHRRPKSGYRVARMCFAALCRDLAALAHAMAGEAHDLKSDERHVFERRAEVLARYCFDYDQDHFSQPADSSGSSEAIP